jgi:hypothetical protein
MKWRTKRMIDAIRSASAEGSTISIRVPAKQSGGNTMGCDNQFDVAGEPQPTLRGGINSRPAKVTKLVKDKGPRIQTTPFPPGLLNSSLTPKTDRIAMDVRRILADVLDFNYGESGTTVDSVYIHARRTKKGIKLRVQLIGS